MHQVALLAQFQTQVIPSGKCVVLFHAAGSFFQLTGVKQQEGSEVEVISQGAELIINHRSLFLNISRALIVVGIYHTCIRVGGQLCHAVQGEHTQ